MGVKGLTYLRMGLGEDFGTYGGGELTNSGGLNRGWVKNNEPTVA